MFRCMFHCNANMRHGTKMALKLEYIKILLKKKSQNISTLCILYLDTARPPAAVHIGNVEIYWKSKMYFYIAWFHLTKYSVSLILFVDFLSL